ncbi:MAG: ATPase domain-containing protein [Kiritimatiellia bacterium]|nr:ATPase domain-containing protein [Kiritimatiellia bacterium]
MFVSVPRESVAAMLEKREIGFEPFDSRFGGCYNGRGLLISGRKNSGKTALGIRFLLAGLPKEEKGLILTSQSAQETLHCADSMALPLRQALADKNLLLVEYLKRKASGEGPGDPMIPPEGFLQLGEIIEAHGIRRVVIDTVLPWLLRPDSDRMSERILSLVRAFDRLAVTTLFTLPRPASESAREILGHLEYHVPVAATLEFNPPSPQREFRVTKYLGIPTPPGASVFRIDDPQRESGVLNRTGGDSRTGTGGFAAVMKSRSFYLNPAGRSAP